MNRRECFASLTAAVTATAAALTGKPTATPECLTVQQHIEVRAVAPMPSAEVLRIVDEVITNGRGGYRDRWMAAFKRS